MAAISSDLFATDGEQLLLVAAAVALSGASGAFFLAQIGIIQAHKLVRSAAVLVSLCLISMFVIAFRDYSTRADQGFICGASQSRDGRTEQRPSLFDPAC